MDLQRGDLRVERPQRGRGGLLLVVQRRELDLYRRAGEAQGAPATEGQRALEGCGGRCAPCVAMGLAVRAHPPKPRPMRVLGSRDRTGRARHRPSPRPYPCPRPRQQLAERSPPRSSSSNSRMCGRGSGRKGTSCPLLQVTAPQPITDPSPSPCAHRSPALLAL